MAKKQIQPYWRPNFRIPGTLPDIKVVRTDFIVNSVAIALALVTCFVIFQREFRAHVLRGTVADLEARVEAAKPENKKSLAVDSRFRKAGEYVVELQKFYSSPYRAHELLLYLSNSVSEGLIFKQITLNEKVITVKKKSELGYAISIGGDVTELPILDSYKMQLQSAELFNEEGCSVEVSETVAAPDFETRIFPYRLSIEVKPESMAKKGGK